MCFGRDCDLLREQATKDYVQETMANVPTR